MPLTVYLDSSDFSTLSNAKRTPEQTEILSQLAAWADSGTIIFPFAGAHLMEMAPKESRYAGSANARAGVLVQLCRRNALASIDRLLQLEANRLGAQSDDWPTVLSMSGEWYPDWGSIVSPVDIAETVRQEFASVAKSHGLNRSGRRAMLSRLVGNKRLKAGARKLLDAEPNEEALREALQMYPMRPADLKILWKYVIGTATREQADNAFRESLRDPRWMMQWFEKHHSRLDWFIRWLREPSEKLADTVRELAERARRLRDVEKALGMEGRQILTDRQRIEMHDDFMQRIAARALAWSGSVERPISASDVPNYCPGLATTISTVVWTLWDSASGNPREPKSSDFADAMHSMYAPYVDVFRADGYMAQHVARATEPYGTQVVPKLQHLVPTIQARLNRQAS